jgi:thiol-disulfide isomerase/thioredoxin
MKKTTTAVAVILIVLVSAAVYQTISADPKKPADEAAPKIGFLAPEFKLKDLEGNTEYTVGGKRDKALLLNFWASWCEPCRQEAPDLNALYKKYKDKLDLYAVNATQYDRLDDAKSFVKEYGLQFPAVTDPDGNVLDMYRVLAYPTSFLIDSDGVIRDIVYGIVPKDDMEQKIRKLIR